MRNEQIVSSVEENTEPNYNKRFYTLDILRGIAAFGVIIWHYQHFYYESPNGLPQDFSKIHQPFYHFLSVFYNYGSSGVELFFVLSGFIFFWLYLDKIRKREISLKNFFVLRFSRLYPLHLATLIFVSAFQFLFLKLNGSFVVYPYNDAKHFLLNLFFVSHWGFQNGWSFNAPVWSVSLEIFAYVVFFVFAFGRFRSVWHVLGLLLAFKFAGFVDSSLRQVIYCFFVGGITYLTFNKLSKNKKIVYLNKYIVVVLLLLAIVSAYLSADSINDLVINPNFLNYISFPSLVLSCAFLQSKNNYLGKKLSFIGDISYSTYLIHFPLQLLIIGFSKYLGISLKFGAVFFVFYIATLVFISQLSYRRFEVPVQRLIRSRFINW